MAGKSCSHRAVRTVIPSGQIDWQVPGGSPAPVPVVRGLEIALDQALVRRATLRETGFAVEAAAVT